LRRHASASAVGQRRHRRDGDGGGHVGGGLLARWLVDGFDGSHNIDVAGDPDGHSGTVECITERGGKSDA